MTFLRAGANLVEVFCDGSIGTAVMTDPFTSHLGTESSAALWS
jgi:hypothetical protein